MNRTTAFLALALLLFSQSIYMAESLAEEAIDGQVVQALQDLCVNCHGADDPDGGVVLDVQSIDWNNPHADDRWTLVHEMISSRQMPPADSQQPSKTQRRRLLHWLDATLTQHVQTGGTVLRRLNREEYENTIRDVLGIPFEVPQSFPADTESHGFDNIGEGLVLSPPLMSQYMESATRAADQLLPPQRKQAAVQPQVTNIGPGDFSLNFTSGHQIDGVLRMVDSSDPLSRGSVWPNRFEARVSGVYEVEIDISKFKAGDHIPIVHLVAPKIASGNFVKVSTLRKLAEFRIESDSPNCFRATVQLQRGQTIAVHYDNAPLSSDKQDNIAYLQRISGQLIEAFRDDPKLGAAWMKAGYKRSDRAWSWWKRIQAIRAKGDLNIADFEPDSKKVSEFAIQMARQGVNTVETMGCMYFSKGPGINIHRMQITGPIRLIEDDEERQQRMRTARFMGNRNGQDDRTYATTILRSTLTKAFRRPVSEEQLQKYVTAAMHHQAGGRRFEDGLHLAIRAALCSTSFLFREYRDGPMDDHDLATRLSYFLTTGPPDAELRQLAVGKKLSNPIVLEEQTRRLLKHKKVKNFLDSFTGQWLDLRRLPQIMPDARLLKWIDKDRNAVTNETEMFVAEILRKNLPLQTFIDSDFTFLNRRNAKLYNIKFPKSDTMTRVQLPPNGIRGGILTHASVLMATANGVDTQPVLRGAWMLENIFGTPTPPPPPDVPAIEPDTSGAKTIRELLNRHKADTSCARCHLKIDPPGFVLENFDPVGRWRDHYPIYEKRGDKVVTRDGQPVDANAIMPDGTVLGHVSDLKQYLIEHIDVFSNCLTSKLMTYATGRPMNFSEQKVINKIVKDVKERGNGFQDLIIAIVQSDVFRTK